MKKLLLIFMMLVSLTAFSQRKTIFPVSDSLETFGITLPAGSFVFDKGANKLWFTSSVASASDSLPSLAKTLIADSATVGGSPNTNIGNSDLFLTGNRILDGDVSTYDFTGVNIGAYQVGAESFLLTSSPNDITLNGASGITLDGATTAKGKGATSSTKSLSVTNSASTEYFFIRDDGMVSSVNGYSLNGVLWSHAEKSGVSDINSGNVFIGKSVGLSNTNFNNVGIGNAAFQLITSGTGVAVGQGAGSKVITGVENAFFGNVAGNMATGSQNTFIGVKSSQSNALGSFNTSVGSSSGSTYTEGTGLTFVGAASGTDGLGPYSNSIAIGRNAKISASNQMVIGSQTNAATIDNVYWGAGVSQSSITPLSFTSQITNITDASGVDVSSDYHWIRKSSAGTGTGLGGKHIFQVAPASGTGSTQNTFVDALVIHQDATVQFSNLTTTPTAGFVLQSTDASGNSDWFDPALRTATETFFLDPKGSFGTGGGWADEGFISDFPVLLFSDVATESAVYMFYGLTRAKFDAVDPSVGFILYSTGVPVITTGDTIVLQLEAKYIAQGESTAGPADETIEVTVGLETLTVNTRQANISFTLDRTLISSDDVIHLQLTRKGGLGSDSYSSDLGIGQAGIFLETTNHNP